MVVQYYEKSFLKVLFKWRGSIWKNTYRPLIIFLLIYYFISLIYRLALGPAEQRVFERVVLFTAKLSRKIPLQFMLGFYVGVVLERWYIQYFGMMGNKTLCWSMLLFLGPDESLKNLRRTFARNVTATHLLLYRSMSSVGKKQFPTDQHLMNAGVWTEEEVKMYQGTVGQYDRWFIPMHWALNMMKKANREKRISDYGLEVLVREVNKYYSAARLMIDCDFYKIPLIYTQLVTISTLAYFMVCLVGRQALLVDPQKTSPGYEIDIIFPIFTCLELIFYVGWYKVGVNYLSPWGEDDDDIDFWFYEDYAFNYGFYFANDIIRYPPPEIVKDAWFGMTCPVLPHSVGSAALMKEAEKNYKFPLNLENIKLTEQEMKIVTKCHDTVIHCDPWPRLNLLKEEHLKPE